MPPCKSRRNKSQSVPQAIIDAVWAIAHIGRVRRSMQNRTATGVNRSCPALTNLMKIAKSGNHFRRAESFNRVERKVERHTVMQNDNRDNSQPMRELEWLARYFGEHCREDLAEDIFNQIRGLRRRAQNFGKSNASQLVDGKQENVGNAQNDEKS